jgi:hypothetical protein
VGINPIDPLFSQRRRGQSGIMSSGGSVKLQRNRPFIQATLWIVNPRS